MFLYTSNSQLENVLLQKMPLTMAIKASRCLGISLRDIFTGKMRKPQYEILKKVQTFHDLMKGKTHTQNKEHIQNPGAEEIHPMIKLDKRCEWRMFKRNKNDQKSKKYSVKPQCDIIY